MCARERKRESAREREEEREREREREGERAPARTHKTHSVRTEKERFQVRRGILAVGHT